MKDHLHTLYFDEHTGSLKPGPVINTFTFLAFVVSIVLYILLALVYPQHALVLDRLYTACDNIVTLIIVIPIIIFVGLFSLSLSFQPLLNYLCTRKTQDEEQEQSLLNRSIKKNPLMILPICLSLVLMLFPLWITFMSIALGVLQLKTVPNRNGEFSVAGIRDSVTIRHEGTSNVIHIKANNDHDVFFAQGWVSARERSWLFEFQKRIAYGTLSELVGEAAYNVDLFSRTIGFHRSAVSAYASLSQQTKETLDAYCNGYNAWLDTNPPLPIEFTIFKTSPSKCTPMDVVVWGKIMYWFNSNNLRNEADRLLMLSVGTSLKRALELLPPYPSSAATIITSLSQLGINMTREEALLVEQQVLNSTFTYKPHVKPSDESVYQDMLLSRTLLKSEKTGASNNWVVDGKYTASGKPFIANDPHMGFQAPSLWLIMKLESPNFNAFGTSFVGVPGLVLGRNEHISFTMTNGIADQQDLYVLKLDPNDSNRYMIDNQSIPFELISETIKIAGKEDKILKVKISKWGPVVNNAHPILTKFLEPISLRWGGNLDNDTSMDTFACHWRAANWEQYSNCFKSLFGPTMNNIYADVNGTIGYVAAGKIPKRKLGHSGLFAVNGDSNCVDYDGYVEWDSLFHITNPKEGFLATSNNRVAPAGVRYPTALDYEVYFRVSRTSEMISERIANGSKFDLEYMKHMQLDRRSKYFENLRFALVGMENTNVAKSNAKVMEWISKLKKWDGVMKSGTEEGTLFEFWIDQLARFPFRELGQERLRESAHMMYVLNMMNNTLDPACNGSCYESAAFALERCIDMLMSKHRGEIPSWGESSVHTIEFRHQLFGTTPLKCLSSVSVQAPGGSEIVNVADANEISWETGKITTLNGPNFRMLVDMGSKDNGKFMFDLGQDGNMLTHEYDENVMNWMDGFYHNITMNSDLVVNWRYQQRLIKV
jgi:penicillin amidase